MAGSQEEVAGRAPGLALLHVSALAKSFGGVAAVVDCSLLFGRGAVTGLIGPNGAGKTTLLDLSCGLGRPDRGLDRSFLHQVIHDGRNQIVDVVT